MPPSRPSAYSGINASAPCLNLDSEKIMLDPQAAGTFIGGPMIKPAERTHRVEYAIRDILVHAEQAKAAGKQLLYLNIGDPMIFDFKTPPHMIEACYKALLDNHTGYANSSGLAEARQAIGN